MAIEVRCPFCQETTTYNEKMEFYKCGLCGCEIWPETSGAEPVKSYAIGKIYSQEIHRPHKPGKSGKSGRKRGKKVQKKPRISSEYLMY